MKTFFDAYFSDDHEIEESLDKLRDLSLFSTHGDEIRSRTLKLFSWSLESSSYRECTVVLSA